MTQDATGWLQAALPGQEHSPHSVNACLLYGDAATARSLRDELSTMAITIIDCDLSDPIQSSGMILNADVLIIEQTRSVDDTLATVGRLRVHTPVGIALLTDRQDEDFRRLALSFGVDHVFAKPVDPSELAIILRNLARLSDNGESMRRKGEKDDAWVLDHTHWRLIAPNGGIIELMTSEYKLLIMLMARPGVARTREELLQALNARGDGGQGRSLDTLISKLRSKIEAVAGKGVPLRSVRGVGYVFVG